MYSKKPSKLNFSIILPTYNENDNIPRLIQLVDEQLKNYSREIIVVDDFSPDGTWKTAQKLKSKYKSLKVIVRKQNHGLALSIKEGILKSKGDVLIIMDSDLSHPPRFLPTLVNEIMKNDVVVASRFVKSGRMVYGSTLPVYASKFINFFVRTLLRLNISDVTGGFFAIRRKVLDKVNINKIFRFYGDYFFHLMYDLKGSNLRIKEIPFTYEPRLTGRSKTRLIRTGLLYVREVLKILLGID